MPLSDVSYIGIAINLSLINFHIFDTFCALDEKPGGCMVSFINA